LRFRVNGNGGGGRAELYLYDQIGAGFFGGIASKDVVETLNAFAARDVHNVDVRINSPGGEVFEGFGIYNALLRYPGVVTTYIDGAAWSIASVIAMAGQRVVAADNAEFMIHNPAALLFGDAEDFRRIAVTLDATKDSLITAYQRHTNAGRDRLSAWMDAETWFTAADAADAGFVDSVEAALPIAACYPASVMKFKSIPKRVQDKYAFAPARPLRDARVVEFRRVTAQVDKFRKAV